MPCCIIIASVAGISEQVVYIALHVYQGTCGVPSATFCMTASGCTGPRKSWSVSPSAKAPTIACISATMSQSLHPEQHLPLSLSSSPLPPAEDTTTRYHSALPEACGLCFAHIKVYELPIKLVRGKSSARVMQRSLCCLIMPIMVLTLSSL